MISEFVVCDRLEYKWLVLLCAVVLSDVLLEMINTDIISCLSTSATQNTVAHPWGNCQVNMKG